MPPEAIRTALHQEPFVPFRIHLTDGRAFEIRHPEMMVVAARTAAIGVYQTAGTFPDHLETVTLIHIVSLEPLPQLA